VGHHATTIATLTPTVAESAADTLLAAFVGYRPPVKVSRVPAESMNRPGMMTPDWVVSGLTELTGLSIGETPEPFIRRGVIIHESDLVSYCWLTTIGRNGRCSRPMSSARLSSDRDDARRSWGRRRRS
jgi:hypothetical protein